MAKTNKYALVTGGSRGIGREICLKLGGCGYHVLVNYKSNAAEAEKTAEAYAEAEAKAADDAAEPVLRQYAEQNPARAVQVFRPAVAGGVI